MLSARFSVFELSLDHATLPMNWYAATLAESSLETAATFTYHSIDLRQLPALPSMP